MTALSDFIANLRANRGSADSSPVIADTDLFIAALLELAGGGGVGTPGGVVDNVQLNGGANDFAGSDNFTFTYDRSLVGLPALSIHALSSVVFDIFVLYNDAFSNAIGMEFNISPAGDMSVGSHITATSFGIFGPNNTTGVLIIDGAMFLETRVCDDTIDVETLDDAFDFQMENRTNNLVITPTVALASGTIRLNVSPVFGQMVRIASTDVITALTVTALNPVVNPPTSFAAGGFASFIYDGTSWLRNG